MVKISNLDYLLLGLLIILVVIFFNYYPSFNTNVETKTKIDVGRVKKPFEIHNNNFDEKNKNQNNFTLYNPDLYYDTVGFQNELIRKYMHYDNKNIDNYFTEPDKNIPLDYTYTCSKIGNCPVSKEQKYDLPLKNMPMCYIKNNNKNTQLSNEIKNVNVSEITTFEINEDYNNIKQTLHKNTKELPIANINVNYLESNDSSFISESIRKNTIL